MDQILNYLQQFADIELTLEHKKIIHGLYKKSNIDNINDLEIFINRAKTYIETINDREVVISRLNQSNNTQTNYSETSIGNFLDIKKLIVEKEYINYIYASSDNRSDESTNSNLLWYININLPSYSKGIINLTNFTNRTVHKIKLHKVVFDNLTQPHLTNLLNGVCYIELTNLAETSFFSENFRFHFYLTLSDRKGSRCVFTPKNSNNGFLYFRTPINIFDSLSVKFYSSTSLVEFPAALATTTGSFVNRSLINGSDTFPYVLAIPDTYLNPNFQYTVRLSGFTTNNPIADAALISAFNQIHTLTYIRTFSFPGITINTMWEVPIDLTGASINVNQVINFNIELTETPKVNFWMSIYSKDI
jgi:hypothetical protein